MAEQPPPTVAESILAGTLAEASFLFETNAADLAAFARAHLKPLITHSVATPHVTVRLRWHEGQPPHDRVAAFPHLAGMERIDRDLYLGSDELHWFRVDDLRDLFVRLAWRDSRLSVEGDFYYRVANDRRRDRAKRWLYRTRVRALRRRRFTTLLYYLVYYPCWWWLEHSRGLHPIHTAGVQIGSHVVLLGGASGVGKSTLAVALAATSGARLLSDSFVLHDGAEVFAVPEPVLLDRWSRNWLGECMQGLEPVEWRYCLDRDGFHFPPQRLATSGQVSLLVLPRRAPESYVRRIAAEDAHRHLSAADLIINDLRRYWAFAAVIELMVPRGLVMRRERQLAKLTAEVPCYELGLGLEATRAAAVESVTRLIRDTPLRAAGSYR